MKLLAAILISACAASAATYYIDYDAGDNTSAGTSSASPWKHAPGDGRASDSANITLALDDVLIFKGGVSYLLDSAGGGGYINANQHRLTFKSGHLASPQWGTSPAIINGTNAANAGEINGVLNVTKTNITVDGLFFLGLEYQDSYAGAVYYRSINDPEANLVIQNCTFSNIVESAIYVAGRWTDGFNANFTVTNCTFKNIGTHGVFFRWGLTNSQVLNCTFDNIGTRTDSPGPGGDPVGVFGNDSPTWNAGLVVRGNDMANVPIKSYVILSSQHSGALIEQNFFHGTNGYSGFDLNGFGTNLTVRNNVFDMRVNNFRGVITSDTDQGNIVLDGLRIYNNTIRAHTPHVGVISLMKGNSTLDTGIYNVDIRNNIIIQQNASKAVVYVGANNADSGPIVDLATFVCDYNIYQTNGGPAFVWSGDNADWDGWKTATGGDGNSDLGTLDFLGASDLRLASTDTIAINTGVNLSPAFTTDFVGRTRGSMWDIGAYEYGTRATATTANVGTINGE